jgi:hypothetical protein
MKNITITLTEKEYNNLKLLVNDFESYSPSEKIWNFNDLDAQREIGCEIIDILINKI